MTYQPMLATPWPAAFDDSAWGFELKWDGVRAIATSAGGSLQLRSRNGNDLSGRYPSIAALLVEPCVIDGEVVAVGPDGRPSFERLARAGHEPTELQFVAFDILELAGKPVLQLPLVQRRERLIDVTGDSPIVVNDITVGAGLDLFDAVRRGGLEGIVAKRLNSFYQPGKRTPDWRKVLNLRTVRCLVGGFTVSEAGEPFGALLLGLLDGDQVRFVGRVGSGFSATDRRRIREALEQMSGPNPFGEVADMPDSKFCVPSLVAHIEFREWTGANRLRGPVFKGFGGDDPSSITWEAEGPSV